MPMPNMTMPDYAYQEYELPRESYSHEIKFKDHVYKLQHVPSLLSERIMAVAQEHARKVLLLPTCPGSWDTTVHKKRNNCISRHGK